MRTSRFFFLITGTLLVLGCSPVKVAVTNEYKLTSYSARSYVSKPRSVSLLVTAPEAVAGYQTEQMLYMKKPFQVQAFVKNAWTNPPADMLYPLLEQSLQKTGYFYAVASSPHYPEADYRLDTQLLSLDQNFLKKPSVI